MSAKIKRSGNTQPQSTTTSRAVFSFVACPEHSMIASTRLARHVSEKMRAPLVWDETIADLLPSTLVIVNGAYAFCRHLEPLSRAILAARRIVWIQNDYTIIPPREDGDATSPFRRAFVERQERGMAQMDFWTTCEKWASTTPASALINWNALTTRDLGAKFVARQRAAASAEMLYYGSYRTGSGKSSRVPYFERYFSGGAAVPIVISCPQQAAKHFARHARDHVRVVGPIENLQEGLGLYGSGLFLQDRKSNEEYHSPPNRFYEMLSAGLPMIFQPECGSMLRRAGYDPEPYSAGTPREVALMHARREQIGVEQRATWLPHALEEHRKLTLDAIPLAWGKLLETIT